MKKPGFIKYRPKVFQNFFLGKQLSQTADESAVCVHLRSSAFICVHLRSFAVHNMQIPENIWPGT